MSRLALLTLLPLSAAGAVHAQSTDATASPHQQHGAPAASAPPAAAQAMGDMPGMAPIAQSDPHAGHDMSAMKSHKPSTPGVAQVSPPTASSDHAAERFYDPAAMAAARAQLRFEHGGMPVSKVTANLFEYQARSGADGYRWDGQAWFGGDIDRVVIKSEGEGERGGGLETGEVQALYSRAVGVYTDLQFGVRQDVAPRGRTYATVGFETLLPYWIDVEGAVFVSAKGDVLGRVEGTYDLRLTDRLILQPRAEFNLAAQDSPETRTGSGLSSAELGLRLRYEIRREFAPYIGVSHDRRFGQTADYARGRGEDVKGTSVVFGVRAFF